MTLNEVEIAQLRAQYEETWTIKDGRDRNMKQAAIRDRIKQLGGII